METFKPKNLKLEGKNKEGNCETQVITYKGYQPQYKGKYLDKSSCVSVLLKGCVVRGKYPNYVHGQEKTEENISGYSYLISFPEKVESMLESIHTKLEELAGCEIKCFYSPSDQYSGSMFVPIDYNRFNKIDFTKYIGLNKLIKRKEFEKGEYCDVALRLQKVIHGKSSFVQLDTPLMRQAPQL